MAGPEPKTIENLSIKIVIGTTAPLWCRGPDSPVPMTIFVFKVKW